MGALLVILGLLALLSLVAVAISLWRSMDAPDQIKELSRIAFEEQLALWRIQATSRQAQAEMRRVRDEHRPRSMKDL